MPAELPTARISIPLRWRDMDMLGHLNQSVYHELLEEGRAALFQSLKGAATFPFVLARVELDYKREVRRDQGPIEVVSSVARVGRSSVTLSNDVIRADGVVAATGSAVLVAWDPQARRSRELTGEERAALGAA